MFTKLSVIWDGAWRLVFWSFLGIPLHIRRLMPWEHQTVGLDEVCIQMFNIYFSSTPCAPGTVLGAGGTAVKRQRGRSPCSRAHFLVKNVRENMSTLVCASDWMCTVSTCPVIFWPSVCHPLFGFFLMLLESLLFSYIKTFYHPVKHFRYEREQGEIEKPWFLRELWLLVVLRLYLWEKFHYHCFVRLVTVRLVTVLLGWSTQRC